MTVQSTQATDYAEAIMDLQLELDIVKIILNEEKSFRAEMEEKAFSLNRDLKLSKEQLLLVNQQYEDANNELKEARSVIEALESQQILSINEMEDLKKSNSHHRNLLRKQEIETISLKEKIFSKEVRDHPPTDGNEKSAIQSKLKKMQDSLEKAKQLNIWYQSDLAFQVSNEEEMDEVRRQAEAETAEVIVCLQEELSVLQKEVQVCQLREIETKKKLVLLEAEMKELQEKLFLMAEDNNQLSGKLVEKDEELKILSEEWNLLTCELEEILVNGHEALIDASDQVNLISSSFPQKRILISEQVGRLIRVLSEKELSIEELGRCLEDANNKRQDVECMLKSLRGAALVINESHQREYNEKEKEILQLRSQLSTKSSIIFEMENKMNMSQLQINKLSDCATVAFIVVSRLSEMNADHIDALKQKDIQLRESAEIIQMKDALLADKAIVGYEAEKQILSLKKEIEKLEETCAKLGEKFSKEELRACSMEQELEDIKKNHILEAQEKLSELKSGVSKLRSCMHMYVEHNGSPEEHDTQVCLPDDGSNKAQVS